MLIVWIIILLILFIIYRKYIVFLFYILYNIFNTILSGPTNGNIPLRNNITKLYKNNFKIIHNFEKIPNIPCIFVIKHPDIPADGISTILIPRNLVFVSAPNFIYKKLFSDVIYTSGKSGKSYDSVKNQIQKKLNEGKSIVSYVTTGKYLKNINCFSGKMRTGTFRIAKELNVPVVPIIFDCFNINDNIYQIHVCDSFYVNDPVNDAYKTKKLFLTHLEEFRKRKL
jgi:hypothetical protein